MVKKSFTDGWKMRKESETESQPVIIPHDAMIHEQRSADAVGGGAHAYFPGGVYIYEKNFVIPEEWKDKKIYLEFEGVYKNAEVSLNGKQLGNRPYGYVPFLISLNEAALYGQENHLEVKADNSKLPNSRWYTGSGIYRPVNLYLGDNNAYIEYHGVRITTTSISPANIRIDVTSQLCSDDSVYELQVQVKDKATVVAEKTQKISQNINSIALTVPQAACWSEEKPYLYDCIVILKENGVEKDRAEEKFGIRTLSWNKNGFFVNGNETLLRGGCVHHDNGLLGAASWEKSEWRRVKIMKEAGFNAIRSSHNPASESMLRACDALGMYVIDESFDTWYNCKNKYDYGCDFDKWWERDTEAMVSRDYNHPSVIMYSIGNEVAEPYEEKGLKAAKEQIECIHNLDMTRPVTCGTNLMILGKAAKGKAIYKDGETNTAAAKKQQSKKESNNSLAFNIMASFIGTGMNKGGNSKRVDAVTTPFLDMLDIAGYNYGSGRYPLEKKAHPDRIVFGSETFPQDIYKNWQMVKQFPYLVGDFMWTAWDHLGEAGLGAWSYDGGMPFNRPYPWLLSGAGVIDILGNPDASCRYASVVWEKTEQPVIGVQPANHPGKRVSKSVWRGTNAVESWSWNGCDGNKTIVEVYGHGEVAELFLNDHSIGKRKLKQCKALFHVPYEPGELKARIFDENGKLTGEKKLVSATGKKKLVVSPEEERIRVGDIVYVNISVQGENGIIESNQDMQISCLVKGGILLGLGSANPCTEERYDQDKTTTYMGRAQAIIYAAKEGVITVNVVGNEAENKTIIVAEK